jgi:hypothetical protein
VQRTRHIRRIICVGQRQIARDKADNKANNIVDNKGYVQRNRQIMRIMCRVQRQKMRVMCRRQGI